MRKVVLLTLSIGSAFILSAQYESEKPNKKVHVGFDLGLGYSNNEVGDVNSENVSITNEFSGRMGVLADVRLFDQVYIAPQADLLFNGGYLEKKVSTDNQIKSTIAETSLEFFVPVLFKLKGERYRPYVLVGPNIRLPLTSREDKTSSDFPWKSDVALDFGIGLESASKYFFFSPELRYSYGFQNVNSNPAYPNVIRHSISLVFKFYG